MTTNSPKYELIIWWSDEDEAFLVEAPELSGCMADGATYEEALANVQAVIREWVETARELGRDIPEPRGRLSYAGDYSAFQWPLLPPSFSSSRTPSMRIPLSTALHMS